MPKVSFKTSDGTKVSFTARKRRSSSRGSRKLNEFAKTVRRLSRTTNKTGPALFKAASREYRKKH